MGWWVVIDKINSADPPVGRQVELAEGNCLADLSAEALAEVESVAGYIRSSARTIKLSEPAIEMLFL